MSGASGEHRSERSHSNGSSRCAVVPVRDGVLPAGGLEAVAEADGRAVLVGSGSELATKALEGVGREIQICEAGPFAPGAWASFLTDVIAPYEVVILPGSPDGRDLAPRLAAASARTLVPSAMRIENDVIEIVAYGGRAVEVRSFQPGTELVVTLQPGVRRVEADPSLPPPEARRLEWRPQALDTPSAANGSTVRDVVVEAVLPPDVSTMDLSEAPRLLGGGAGLDTSERFEQLQRVAESLGAAMGATRVITDRGWLGHDRQIGTTGVVVDPQLYLAFGISGAVQHTAGLGNPEHVISVNLDEHCPMMEMADLAIVADANETLDHLERLIADGVTDAKNREAPALEQATAEGAQP